MPVDIDEDCFVVYNGKISDVEYPVFILRENAVSLAYTKKNSPLAWFYDAENDIVKSKTTIHSRYAYQFIKLTGLQNHKEARMVAEVLTKEMVTFKAVPISGKNNLNYIEDELTDI